MKKPCDSRRICVRSGWRIFSVFVFFLYGTSAYAGIFHDSNLDWKTLHTPHFKIHYHSGLERQARAVVVLAEEVHERLTTYFDWIPQQKTDVILTDETDFANGSATPLPYNRMTLIVTPPDDGLMDHASWLELLIVHEYTHIIHLDRAERNPQRLRSVLGRHSLLFPALYQPRWLLEGLATYMETDTVRGIGRGQSSYFDMLMRMEVLAGLKPISQINQTIRTWPAGIIPYLYGVYFYQFLVDLYGEKVLLDWLKNYSDNLIPFRINGNSKATLGMNMTELWQQYEIYLQEKFAAKIQQRTKISFEDKRLTHYGYNTAQSRIDEAGNQYFIKNDGRTEPALMRRMQVDGRIETLSDVHAGARFDVHETAGIIIAQQERYNNANIYYDLFHIDTSSGKSRRLTEAARYRFASWSRDGEFIAAVKSEKGRYSLDILSQNGEWIENLWTATDGEILSFIDWSPEEDLIVAAVWRPLGGWNLEIFNMETGVWQALTEDAAIPLHPSFSRDGSRVLFSADYDGIYDIYELNINNAMMSRITRVVGGAFHPSEAPSGDTYYIGYHQGGYDLHQLNNKTPLLAPEPQRASTAIYQPLPERSFEVKETAYQSTEGLQPAWWSPVFAVADDLFLLGAFTSGSDPLAKHSYGAALAYEYMNDKLIGSLDYLYDGWYPSFSLHGSRNIALHRSSDNELVRVRQSDYYQATLAFPFFRYREQWVLSFGLQAEVLSDSYVAPNVQAANDEKDYVLGSALSYNSARNYPLSISRSNGRTVSLVAATSGVGDGSYTGEVYSLDWREYLALKNEHVIAFRGFLGWGTDQPRRFQLGGSNPAGGLLNVSASGIASPFNRRDYALRGYSDGLVALRARRAVLASVEWRFPLLRLERGWMAPPLGLDQLSATFFIDSGAAWQHGSTPDRYFTGSGVELNSDVRVFYNLPLRVRLGFAHGFADSGENQLYLQLSTSF
ncbi:hypothetical protein MNBD_GAMMA16-421 [hydrothermal vent metagenome]|uniref:TolB protein, periplasmic protein involved in the tonb-independent uptake of group A colicins n=1 Tax=hydrothermal vent metagenome TaxID=652676 RepID=A0A3B0ZPI9_9ZZZZ